MQDWKIKISALWLIAAVASVADPKMVLLEPSTLASLIAGKIYGQQIGPAFLLAVAILMLVPLLMAFLSLSLRDSMNRWANTIVGAVFAVISISIVVDALTLPMYSGAFVTFAALVYSGALMAFAAFVASALIVWYAWTSKQKSD
jgi:hypothetical protein